MNINIWELKQNGNSVSLIEYLFQCSVLEKVLQKEERMAKLLVANI